VQNKLRLGLSAILDMKANRIALIVDHPTRDLPGLLLLGKSLIERGAQVFLVPMNMQYREIYALAPDFVLLNYVRKNNQPFIRALLDHKIAIGLLDTEGGFFSDVKLYGRVLAEDKSLFEQLSCNLIWGKKMFEYWNEVGLVPKNKNHLTGSPRFDYYAEKFRNEGRELLAPEVKDKKNLVLLNTTVAIANPKYSTISQEIKMYTQTLGIPREEVDRYLTLGRQSIKDNLELVTKLAGDVRELSFVIRPHPHENEKTYIDALSKSGFAKEIYVGCYGNVVPWILNAQAIIHRQCTTAVEAVIAGIPAFSPSWVASAGNAPDAEALSYKMNSYDELKDALKSVASGSFTADQNIKNKVSKVVEDWLFKLDGLAHERAADIIMENLPRERVVDAKKCRESLYFIYKGRKEILPRMAYILDRFSYATQMPHFSWALDSYRQKKWISTGKITTPADIELWLKIVQKTLKSSNQKIMSQKAEATKSYVDAYPGQSLELSLK
jgi:surface carbohydrate biosynthesis protein